MFLSIIKPFKQQRHQNKHSHKEEQVNYVGCMRNRRNPYPEEFFKLLAKACAYYNLTLVYFSPKDVNIETGKINGKILINEDWVQREIDVPKFIDASTLCFKHKEVTEYLNQNSILSGALIGAKGKVYNLLNKNKTFKDIIIPYKSTKDPEEILAFINEHNETILKPVMGHKGANIYKVNMINEDSFTVSYQHEESVLNRDELIDLLSNLVNKSRYICQKYIHSYDKDHNPFDIRIRLERNSEGKWQVVTNLVRVANAQKVVSNVAQGGYVAELESFLKVNYPNNWESVQNKIISIGKEFPPHIEEITGKTLCSLGIDIGLDQQGNAYFYEVNTAPGVEFATGEIATIKSGYFNYKMKN